MKKLPRILVCDDEEGIRESLDLILGQEYALTFAEDGETAMTKAEAERFDVVLLDVKMPRLNGLEVLKWFRQHHPTTRVIMLTAYQSVEIAQEAVLLGATDYVAKPFETKDLQAAVTRALTNGAVKPSPKGK